MLGDCCKRYLAIIGRCSNFAFIDLNVHFVRSVLQSFQFLCKLFYFSDNSCTI